MKKISVIFACLLLLSGCWDKHELEDNTFAVILGLDAAQDGEVVVTVAYPLTQTEGGGLDVAKDSSNYSLMSAKAPSVAEGLKLLGTKLSGPLALYSVKTVVISQELAQGEMLRQVFSSWQYEQIRNTAGVLISQCKAAEFIEARIKNSPIDPLRQEELLLEQINDSAYYQPIQLLELLAALKSDSGDGIAMYGGVASENQENQEDRKEDGGAERKEGYLPGEIPISAPNESRISGLAVFQGGRMVGVLNSLEAQTYSMLTQSKTGKTWTIQDPLEAQCEIVVEVFPTGKSKINSILRNGVPVFYIEVDLKCAIGNIQSGIDYTSPKNDTILSEYIRDLCAEDMKNLIAKIQEEYHADILKLGDKLARHFTTVDQWESYDWPANYKEAEINLNVTLHLEHIGIMLR